MNHAHSHSDDRTPDGDAGFYPETARLKARNTSQPLPGRSTALGAARSSVVLGSVFPWAKHCSVARLSPAKSLQRIALNFRSLQEPASGSLDSLKSFHRQNRQRRSAISPESLSAPVTNGCGASSIRRRAQSSNCCTRTLAGPFSNISCEAAQRVGGWRQSAPVNARKLMNNAGSSYRSRCEAA